MNFLQDLDQVAIARQKAVTHLGQIIHLLSESETAEPGRSGALELSQAVETLKTTRQNLEMGVFRLLVLGDLKRGKSTLLNALLGDRLLPSDVTPCTAVLTVVKYGPQKQVTVYFVGDRPPQTLSFDAFRETYTISPDETKRLEAEQQLAFPQVSHAVVEHPLPLLQSGIELIDTPGLNDTEARNRQVLDYLNSCHAVLFVLSASQPCTLEERRYLQNYLLNRGLTVFFLINGWDRIRDGLVDPEDANAVAEAEAKVRQVFQAGLGDAVTTEAYGDRVFEISALQALRQKLKHPEATLEGTGLDRFLATLGQYLARDRAPAELQRVQALAQQTHQRVREAIERRIPLLEQSQMELEANIASIQSEFDQLAAIRDQFGQLIQRTREEQAGAIAESFKTYILKLELTFEEDFVASQPDLEFLQFIQKENRAKFHRQFRQAFERYMNDRLVAWEFMAKQNLGKSFDQLQEEAKVYADAYAKVIDVMNQKLLGDRFTLFEQQYKSEEGQAWLDAIAEIFEALPDQLNQSIRPFNQFWQQVLLYACIYAAVNIAVILVGIVFSSLFLSIVAALAVGAGVVGAQAEVVRQTFLKKTKEEFVKCLPQIADEQQPLIRRAVQRCFDNYEAEVTERINGDIGRRRAELNNLLKQKESTAVNQGQEVQRLRQLEQSLTEQVQQLGQVIPQTD